MQAVPRRTQAGPGPAGSRRMPPGSLYELTALWERRKPGAGRLAQDNGCWGSRRAPESSRGPRGTRTDGRPFRPVWFRPRVPQHSPQVRSRITLSGSSATSYATRLFHGVSERSQPVPSQPTAQGTPPDPKPCLRRPSASPRPAAPLSPAARTCPGPQPPPLPPPPRPAPANANGAPGGAARRDGAQEGTGAARETAPAISVPAWNARCAPRGGIAVGFAPRWVLQMNGGRSCPSPEMQSSRAAVEMHLTRPRAQLFDQTRLHRSALLRGGSPELNPHRSMPLCNAFVKQPLKTSSRTAVTSICHWNLTSQEAEGISALPVDFSSRLSHGTLPAWRAHTERCHCILL